MDKSVIYTVGHSNHPIEVFIDLLKTFSINCLIDVRSIPASAYSPQYNKEPLSTILKDNNIIYMHFPEEFGARHSNPHLLDEEGKVDFGLVHASKSFLRGVERLRQGFDKGYKITLMCSESDPFDCHRFSMISVALEKDGFEVKHILKDKTIQSNPQLEGQLLKKYAKKIPQPDIFRPNVSPEDQLKVAYRLRNKDIAFSPYSKFQQEENL